MEAVDVFGKARLVAEPSSAVGEFALNTNWHIETAARAHEGGGHGFGVLMTQRVLAVAVHKLSRSALVGSKNIRLELTYEAERILNIQKVTGMGHKFCIAFPPNFNHPCF
jgi:hypothetical protein